VRTLVWAVSPALPAGSARGHHKVILSKSTVAAPAELRQPQRGLDGTHQYTVHSRQAPCPAAGPAAEPGGVTVDGPAGVSGGRSSSRGQLKQPVHVDSGCVRRG
jgi:hypothetical protein